MLREWNHKSPLIYLLTCIDPITPLVYPRNLFFFTVFICVGYMTETGLLIMPQSPINCLHGFSPIFFFFYGSLISAFFMILKLELPFYAGCTTSSLLESSDRVHWENSDSLLPLCTVLPGASQPPQSLPFQVLQEIPFMCFHNYFQSQHCCFPSVLTGASVSCDCHTRTPGFALPIIFLQSLHSSHQQVWKMI